MACTLTDEDLPNLFDSKTWNLNAFDKLEKGSLMRKLTRLFKKGYLMDMTVLETCLRQNMGDITFKEAYDKTKRILNITVASTDKFEFPRLLNYITGTFCLFIFLTVAPNVLIWSACCAR